MAQDPENAFSKMQSSQRAETAGTIKRGGWSEALRFRPYGSAETEPLSAVDEKSVPVLLSTAS